MKIWKHSTRILGITLLMLSSVMVFGYLFNAFSELHAMDLHQDRSANIGVELAETGSDGNASNESDTESEARLAVRTAAYIEESMSGSGLHCEAEVDQANRCIAAMVLSAGICQAVIDGDRDAWSDVCSLAADTSAGWAQALTDAGLEGWHFSVVILNDQHPKYALLISTDGSTIYDCTVDADLHLSDGTNTSFNKVRVI